MFRSTSDTSSYETTITSYTTFTTDGRVTTVCSVHPHLLLLGYLSHLQSARIIPTNLSDGPSQDSDSNGTNRSAAIGGAVGGAAILFALLACLFCWRRKKLRTSLALFSRQPKSRSALLAEEFEEADDEFMDGTRRYSDYPSVAPSHGSSPSVAGPVMTHARGPSGVAFLAADPYGHSASHSGVSFPSPYGHVAPAVTVPRLLRSRGSETGSVFHEDVWPPPGEHSRLVDPLAAASAIDLQSVVSDVMGPAAGAHSRGHTRGTSASSVGSQSGLLPAKRTSWLAPTTPTSPTSTLASSSPAGRDGDGSPTGPKVIWLERKDARRLSTDVNGATGHAY